MASGFSLKDIRACKDIARTIVEPIIRGVRDRKVEGTYKRLKPDALGRIHTALSPDTASARLSSNDTPLFEESTNLQNQEKKVALLDPLYQVRDCIEAPKDWVLLAVDYAGAEAVCVAIYSRDWKWYDQMLSGYDTHSAHVKHFWDRPETIDWIKKNLKLDRDVAKTITYASLYRASVRTITITLNKEAEKLGRTFTEAEVAVLLSKFLQLHPLEQWWNEVADLLRKNSGALRNALGYRRTFHQPLEENRLKDALSFLPQSTVGCLMNRALPIVFNKIELEGRRELLHQVHDELLFMCRPDEIDFIIRTTSPELEHRFKVHGREVYIPADWKVGQNWGNMQSYKIAA
jgi:DNA polymerase I-like protein with 3'-5' exonuclease and polymerase domains